MSNEGELWQVEVKGQIYETNFSELTQWIGEGAVLREDKVRRGNLRWLEAGRIPNLISFFNAKDLNIQPEPVTTTSTQVNFPEPGPNPPFSDHNDNDEGSIADQEGIDTECATDKEPSAGVGMDGKLPVDPNACEIHPELTSVFKCESCLSNFCAQCPKKYSTVRTCPICGSRCTGIVESEQTQKRGFPANRNVAGGFGFADALGYPFRFGTSLISGGIMFALFTLGQSAAAIGGIIMLVGAIFCMMMSNMLTFGILANTVENFSQSQTDKNFMPGFDDFELWKDVIHPFFLYLAACLVSFGMFAVLIIGGIWYVASSITQTMQNSSVTTMMPEAGRDLHSAKSINKIDEVRKGVNKGNVYEGGVMPGEDEIADKQSSINSEEEEFQQLQNMIDEHRKGQMESMVGESPEDQQAQFRELFGNLIGFAFPFVILAFIALLWGLFYFPAACLVAGYTRSFWATLNPLNGLDTIKRLGFDYVKILWLGFVLIVSVGIIGAVVGAVLSPFDMPMMGNIPAKVIVSFFTFYIWIVFSVLLGFAMYKNADRLRA